MAMALKSQRNANKTKIVRFCEIAKNISERVEPSKTDLQIYVGLEHLDPGTLRIRRHGIPSDVEGQKLRVRPGQIIFGKRRAYQRKLAVADFDGICSAHAMVLEANPKTILPELLPFFMQSNMFMERAVAISEGSLSPTIKWKALGMQEFPLPLMENQRKILEILSAANSCKYLYEDLLSSCLAIQNSFLEAWLLDKYKTAEWQKLKTALSLPPQYGATESAIAYTEDTYRYIRVTDITDKGAIDETTRVGAPKHGNEKYRLVDEDFLIARSGNTVGKTFLYREELAPNAIFAGYLIRLKLNEKILLPEYFKYYCKTSLFWRWLEASARGGAQPNINAQQIAEMELPMPSLVDQEFCLKKIHAYEAVADTLSCQLERMSDLNRELSTHLLFEETANDV